MALNVGTDSYVTVEEADKIITDYYTENDPLYLMWKSSDAKTKEVYLRRACMQLETLPYKGIKYNANQTLAFPRKDGDLSKIKIAQCMQALTLTDNVQAEEVETRIALRRAGVTKYSIGNLSETFGGACDASAVSICTPALTILRSYLTGGFRICF